MGWWLGLTPATLEFWVRFPNERNQGKQAHPVLKYRVPHGSQHSFVIGPAVIKHTQMLALTVDLAKVRLASSRSIPRFAVISARAYPPLPGKRSRGSGVAKLPWPQPSS
jgi:hypothetical protein